MENGEVIFKLGTVELAEDTSFGSRIKARLNQDNGKSVEELPWAFPLLPKMFQVIPKLGEGVLVVTAAAANKNSQRYYLGPIISQPQYQGGCSYNYGLGVAASLIMGGLTEPLETIKNFKETMGSYPNDRDNFEDDVSVVGRGTQDIILRNNKATNSNEIDIRCGIKGNATEITSGTTEGVNSLIGNIIFNKIDPSYIQLKYKNGLVTTSNNTANSVINIVADKVNIISNQDDNAFNLTDNEELIPESEIGEMMDKLHQLPHGDTLVKLLKLMIRAILTHVHNFNNLPAVVAGDVLEMASFDPEEILSKHVRIS